MKAKVRYAHEMCPGEQYEPMHFSISAELNQQFLYSIDDFNPIYLREKEGRPAQVHPMILLHMSARTRSRSFILAPNTGSVFAKEKVAFHGPVFVDELLSTRWTIQDVYKKNGKLYQALAITITSGTQLVLDREMHSVFATNDGTTLELPGHQNG